MKVEVTLAMPPADADLSGSAGGIAIGLIASVATTRVMASIILDTPPRDPVAWSVATLVLVVAGLLATLGPAYRAARVDPSIAMRADGSMLSICSLFGSRPSLRIIARAILVKAAIGSVKNITPKRLMQRSKCATGNA